MQFKRLRLAGFKSFVEPADLLIEPGLTGVVGPNGCGKSNLLEAIRWVMGESSPKSLRGGGMEDVIFAGTASRPSRDFADVILLLDNTSRTAPAAFNDNDSIEVVRRIERGLGSAYRLNGRDVRQRDVQLLFADNATGAHSPALVSQGRIGAIIAAKPGERRLLLEEAAGISGLHVRRQEAEIRLRAAEANLLRLDDVLKGLEAQAAALKRQARSAERYRQLSARIRLVEAQLLHARWQAAAAAEDAAKAATATADATVIETSREAARLSSAQAAAAAALPALRDAEAAAAATAQAGAQAGALLAQEALQVERRQRELTAAADANRRDAARENMLGGDAQAAIDRLSREAEVLRGKLEAARGALPAATAALAASEAAAAADEKVLAAAIEAHARAAAQARVAASAIEGAEGRRARAAGEAAQLRREHDALLMQDDAAVRHESAQSALSDATARVARLATEIDAADPARRRAETARELANSAVLTARGAHAALISERDALVRVLTVPQASGGGVAARITVVSGYEAALAAALGDDLGAPLGANEAGRGWAGGGDGAADPSLPNGVTPLGDHVAAPPELARRLRQIGVTDDGASLAAALLPGQRLVSRDGRMWRWDGFRAFGGSCQAAVERFVQRNRLAEIEVQLPASDVALSEARAMLAAAENALTAAAAAERDARTARTGAERAQAAAQAALTAAMADAGRRAERLDALAGRIARLTEEAADHARDAEAARGAADDAVELPRLAESVTSCRVAAEASRAALVAARQQRTALTADLDRDAERLAAAADERNNWVRRQTASTAQRSDLGRRAATIAEELLALADRPAAIALQQLQLADDRAAADAERREAADRLAVAEAALRQLDAAARAAAEAQAGAREARATAAANADHAAARRAEVAGQAVERFGCAPRLLPEVSGFDAAAPSEPDDLTAAFETLSAERERLGPVNLRAEVELAELDAIVTGSAAERGELETAIARLRGSIGALNREGRVRLLDAFKAVDGHFRDLFATLFAGGAAHLELTESDDPLEAGLEIMAQPPGKKLQSLTLLSGGEQALTAVALIFALFLTNPAPICVLDEVDAPLDDANVERFCDLLDRMAADTATRFLIVTHNAVTMSRMHRLYGVTMSEPGVSQLVSVDLARAELLLAAE